MDELADSVAERHGSDDAQERDDRGGEAHRQHLLGCGFEADVEEEEYRPKLGNDGKGLAGRESGEAGASEEHQVAEEDADEKLAEDRGLADPGDERTGELGPGEDEGESEKDLGLLLVRPCRRKDGGQNRHESPQSNTRGASPTGCGIGGVRQLRGSPQESLVHGGQEPP